MNLDQYQETAGRTNLWPKVFTEDQVRNLVARAYLRGEATIDAEEAYAWADLDLEREVTPLNKIVYHILGLCEEAGEIAGKAKKIVRDKGGKWTPEDHRNILLEAGDALWYTSQVAGAIDVNFSDVAEANLEKLADRAQRGVLGGSGDHR